VRRALPLLLLLLACGVGPNGLGLAPPVAQVRVTPAVTSLREGESVRLVAVTLDANGNPVTPRKTPKWFTPDAIHVSVDTTGLVRGLLAGPAEIQVTADSVTGTARVTVLALPAASIVVTLPAGTIELGDTARVSAIVRDASGKRLLGSTVRWASSDTSRARIDSTGLLRAVGTGAVTLTAAVDSITGSANLMVFVPVASVTLAPDSLALQYDDTARLTVTLRDSTGTVLPARPITWSLAGDSGIVELSPGLLVSALGAGRATLVASTGHVAGRTAIEVTGLDLSTITVGQTHSCGLRRDGVAFCWGDGSTGALGRGNTESSNRPRRVPGGLTFAQLKAGPFLTCGVTPSGDTYCWGRNDLSQTGTAGGVPCTLDYGRSGVCVLTPTRIGGGVQFAAVIPGTRSVCGLTAAGAAYCWGAGGILGDSTTQASAVPVAVVGGLVFRDLADPNDDGTCGRTDAGTIYCWGLAPSPLTSGTGFDFLAGSGGSFCGLRAGALFCWGWIPTDDYNFRLVHSPVALLSALRFTDVASTANHLCGVTDTGSAVCWGSNLSGALGDGTLTSRFDSTGTVVAGGHTFTRIVTSGVFLTSADHSCGLARDGRAYCWGANTFGQIGAPIGARALVPAPPSGQP
jgi:Bacterial Ig-like domain (group 2)/Regulator of chromosome condensation (RCC1) repeat